MTKIDLSKLEGNIAEGLLLVTAASLRETKTGKSYVDMTLTDGRNQINAKKWDSKEVPAVNAILDIAASISEYMGKPQLTLTSFKELGCVDCERWQAAFLPTRDYNIEQADQDIKDMLEEVLVDTSYVGVYALREFVDELFLDEKVHAMWLKSTAAVSMHHVQAGGLMRHTCETMMLTRDIARVFEKFSLSPIHLQLAVVGALFHDIGKILTYESTGTQFVKSNVGKMAEHITLGCAEVISCNAGRKYPHVAALLTHIIASHHGELAFGSPVKPASIEAMIVSMADSISAKVDTAIKATEDAGEKDWTPKVFGLDTEIMTPYLVAQYLLEGTEPKTAEEK